MVESEDGVGLKRRHETSAVLLEHVETQTALRAPEVVADEGLGGQEQPPGVDDERELGEHEVALRHGEGVHVGGAVDRHLGDDALRPAVVGNGEQTVAALAPEDDDVAEAARALHIVMRVRDRDLPPDLRAISAVAERCERLGIEAHGQRRLRQGNGLAAEHVDVDIAVVGERRLEDRGDALKQRAAGVGREAALRE